jgi:predicted nucleic acid-binding Zn ribbon protein
MAKQLRSEKTLSIKDIIEHSPKLARLGVLDEGTGLDIHRHWEAVVGDALAAKTRPLRFRQGTLTVAVKSPAWMQQLTMMKPQLLARLAAALGREAVRDLRFTLTDFDLKRPQ